MLHPDGYYARNKERWKEYDRARRTGDWSKYQQMRHETYLRRKEKAVAEALRHREKIRPRFREADMYSCVAAEYPGFERWTVVPDMRHVATGEWMEVKMGSVTSNQIFREKSAHFPGLFLRRVSKRRLYALKTVDEQIEAYPRPLIVVVYDAYSGERLAEKRFE